MKESSLEALGYISQDMPAAVMERSANPILTAIVHGMREGEPSLHVRLAAINALLNSLEFAGQHFEQEVCMYHIYMIRYSGFQVNRQPPLYLTN